MGGYKCLRGDIARRIDLKPGYHRFLPAIVNQMGGKITEIEITAPERKKGKSKYGVFRFLDVLMDILMLWFESSTKSRPLYFIGRICLAFFLIATLIFFWLVFEKLKFGYPIAARPPFFLSILLYTLSFIMFFQALVLEFLSDIYRKLTGNDNYIIKKTHPEKEEK
jgi:dolichol-phosphate mannosyltransferase